MEILKLNQKNYKEIFERAVRTIRKGEVLVCPTDTVYGLICDAANEKAVKRLFKIKKRPRKKPIPIFVKDIKMARKFAQIDKKQERFLKKVWPGAITAVLKSKKSLPAIGLEPKATGRRGKSTIGMRMPKYTLILNLIKKINRPLAESSANISGEAAATKIKEVLKQFKNQKYQPDLILDAGNLKKSRPSRVIDLTKDFKILRN